MSAAGSPVRSPLDGDRHWYDLPDDETELDDLPAGRHGPFHRLLVRLRVRPPFDTMAVNP